MPTCWSAARTARRDTAESAHAEWLPAAETAASGPHWPRFQPSREIGKMKKVLNYVSTYTIEDSMHRTEKISLSKIQFMIKELAGL